MSAYKLKYKSISAISIDFHRDIHASLSFTFVTAFAEHAVHVAHAIKRKVLITPTLRQLCSVQCRTTAHSLLGRQYAGVAWLSRATRRRSFFNHVDKILPIVDHLPTHPCLWRRNSFTVIEGKTCILLTLPVPHPSSCQRS